MSIYSDLNNVTFSGRLATEPKFYDKTEQHSAFTNVVIASNKRWKNKEGEWNSTVVYLTVYFNNGLAKYVATLNKGDNIIALGSLRSRKDKNDHYVVELIADDLRVISKKQKTADDETAEVVEIQSVQ